jgi:mono/diheme cytochrome c family protein
VAPPKKKNPWTSTSEILLWLLVVALLFPAAFAGYAVGHYTSLGKPPATVTVVADGTVTSPTTTMTTTPATTTSSSGGDVAAGLVVFNANGCGACHALSAAGSAGGLGPDLNSAVAADAQDAGMPLDAFVSQSITDPSAYIAKNYSDGIMPPDFGTKLKPTEITDLVALIVSGAK